MDRAQGDKVNIDKCEYEIRGILSGGFGKVYHLTNTNPTSIDPLTNTHFLQEHFHEVHRQEIAAKTLQEKYDMEIFSTECLLHLPLRHPGITPLVSVKKIDETIFGLMPFREFTLESLIGNVDTINLIKSLANAMHGMEFAYKNFKLVHRDLKPANILANPSEGKLNLEVCDWGIAKSVAGDLHEHSGTIPYMSPERLCGDSPKIQHDIFSFGIIIFQIIFGTIPYNINVIEDLRTGRYYHYIKNSTPHLPKGIRSVILKSTHPDPSKRYHGYRQFISSINKL